MEFPMYPVEAAQREQDLEDSTHLWAISILDSWAEKHEFDNAPTPKFHRFTSNVDGKSLKTWTITVPIPGCPIERHSSASSARISVARKLFKQDPSL